MSMYAHKYICMEELYRLFLYNDHYKEWNDLDKN